MIHLTGTMTCPPDRLDSVRAALPVHVALTRAEPGCVQFDVTEPEQGVFAVSEIFADRPAFDAHQSRAASSDWARTTDGLPRDYSVTEK
ncbi:putative quinol monooxygenase [Loktanella sp. SALINAS62]|uniref:putative quinol monooxygenase n=1 Tax=Loktanella sp. SALINAS62 TaxID=2706124 RepID=UPI0032C4252B